MGSISKRREIEDRISNLPPHLVSRILSFLPTRQAVRSSILSTFWRRQWTSITRLSFCDGDLPRFSPAFVGLVYHVLLFLEVTSLDEFHLRCLEDKDGTIHITTWFAVALSRNVRRVMVDVSPDNLEEPLFLHSCTTLEVLDLGRDLKLRVPSSISLVRLRILRFRSITFLDDASFFRLVSNCPVLEELNIQESLGFMSGETINISSTTLKRLIISFSWADSIDGFFDNNLVVNTPSLQYFEHEAFCNPISYKFQNLLCLDTARIKVKPHDYELNAGNDDEDVFKPISDLAAGISRVRILHISKCFFEALSCSPFRLPKFHRLTTLNIGGLKSTGCRLLMAFLESSPKLAILSFEVVINEDDSLNWSKHFEEICVGVTCVPRCMLFSLKAIGVTRFKLSEVEMEIVRYFLKQSNCLKKLIIDNRNRNYWKGKMPMVREKLLKFPRSSPLCEVVLMGD